MQWQAEHGGTWGKWTTDARRCSCKLYDAYAASLHRCQQLQCQHRCCAGGGWKERLNFLHSFLSWKNQLRLVLVLKKFDRKEQLNRGGIAVIELMAIPSIHGIIWELNDGFQGFCYCGTHGNVFDDRLPHKAVRLSSQRLSPQSHTHTRNSHTQFALHNHNVQKGMHFAK